MEMPELLLNPGLDRPPTPKEIAQELRNLYRDRGVLADTRRDDMYVTFVVVLCDPDDQYAANLFDGEQAEREWWQRDHVLTGLGMSIFQPEAQQEALAGAKRAQLEKLRLCLWFDKGVWPDFIPRYRIFRRAPRLAPHYRPAGPELSPAELRILLT
jgi:hypothetical protein